MEFNRLFNWQNSCCASASVIAAAAAADGEVAPAIVLGGGFGFSSVARGDPKSQPQTADNVCYTEEVVSTGD